ncbi:Cyclin-dependent kinase F-1 [Stylosanthes scabra]|uniref:Cyclin-dependent kinase F-1 n=1 Tax=Stylosanthes scabra TaxID=79078 RepID=A0ABU6TFF7_9FABA|nr:Cyclin-dependent kinase F-1 [Stylosanthes scabra]
MQTKILSIHLRLRPSPSIVSPSAATTFSGANFTTFHRISTGNMIPVVRAGASTPDPKSLPSIRSWSVWAPELRRRVLRPTPLRRPNRRAQRNPRLSVSVSQIDALQILPGSPNVIVLHEYFWREDEEYLRTNLLTVAVVTGEI